MKILLFGPRGYLGTHVIAAFPGVVPSGADIADAAGVAAALDEHKPDVVINAAGKTGVPNVDWCEDHKQETIRANVTGPLVLLDACLSRGIKLVHVSSGCIYEGDESHLFTEEEISNFAGSFYSRTKAWSEEVLREFPVLIVRLRMPFDDTRHPRSLLTKLAKYERVLDVRNSLTYLPDFLTVMKTLIEKKAVGIYNVVNPGPISPYEIMEMYTEIVDPAHRFEKLSLESLSDVTKAARSNCVLSTEKLEKEGITLRPAREVLRIALSAIAKERSA